MNRDAKIGIVVILVIVAFLVIIWGRESGDDTAKEVVNNPQEKLPTHMLDTTTKARSSGDNTSFTMESTSRESEDTWSDLRSDTGDYVFGDSSTDSSQEIAVVSPPVAELSTQESPERSVDVG